MRRTVACRLTTLAVIVPAVVALVLGLILMTGPARAVTAVDHNLTVSFAGLSSNGGKVTSSPAGIECGSGFTACGPQAYADGTPVTLTATPNSGWEFTRWGFDPCQGQGTTCSLTMDADKSVSATFFDIERPTAALTSPTADRIRGIVELSATASDNFRVSKVEFLAVNSSLESMTVGEDTTDPYSLSWDTTTVPFDEYRIQARATDAYANTSLIVSSAEHFVTVDNLAPDVNFASPLGKKVSPRSPVTANFSEPMDKGSVEAKDPTTGNLSTFTLKKKGSRTTVAATAVYDPDAFKATLTPAKKLRSGATYIATVTTAATDEVGNSLDQNSFKAGNQPKTWSFTVR
jgi:hypothetical protein